MSPPYNMIHISRCYAEQNMTYTRFFPLHVAGKGLGPPKKNGGFMSFFQFLFIGSLARKPHLQDSKEDRNFHIVTKL